MICVAFFDQFCQKLHFYSIVNLILRFTKEEAACPFKFATFKFATYKLARKS